MELSIYDEFGLTETALKLEPARRCAFHCDFCHIELSRKAAAQRSAARGERKEETRGDFFRVVARAFGPAYDPTDFRQFWLREGYPICWSSGVEPFQDWPRARDALQLGNDVGLRWFVQTRGLNWTAARELLRVHPSRHVVYVSLLSLDEAHAKRHEIGAPPPAERLRIMADAKALGFKVIAGIAPHFWSSTPQLPALVDAVLAADVDAVVFDPLHITSRQAAVIPAANAALIEASLAIPSDADLEIVGGCADRVVENGRAWIVHNGNVIMRDLESVGTTTYQAVDAKRWPYRDKPLFERLAILHAEIEAPIALGWPDVLAIMESDGPVTRPFAWSRFRTDVHAVRHLAADWEAYLKACPRPIADYFRALWNHPRKDGFFWRHPFVRHAVKPDGSPYVDAAGNVVAVYDPDATLGPARLELVIGQDALNSLYEIAI